MKKWIGWNQHVYCQKDYLKLRAPFCTSYFLIAFMDVHTRENKTLPMYIMYANALNNTPSYTSYPCLPLTLVYTWYEESTPQLGQPSLVQLMSLRHPCVMCSLPNVWFCNTHTHTPPSTCNCPWSLLCKFTSDRWSGRFFSIIRRDPSVCNSNWFTCWHPPIGFPSLKWGIFFYKFLYNGQ